MGSASDWAGREARGLKILTLLRGLLSHDFHRLRNVHMGEAL